MKTRREVLSELHKEATQKHSAAALMAYHKEKTRMKTVKACDQCNAKCTQDYDFFRHYSKKGGYCRKCYFNSL